MFQELGDAGYKLIVEDDGQGLSTERIKEAALKKGFITPERARPWIPSRYSPCCFSRDSPPSKPPRRMRDGASA